MGYRKGSFSSSKVGVLTKKGRSNEFSAPALTYINDKRIEVRLNRSLSRHVYSRDIYWGYAMEKLCFELLGFQYDLESDQKVTRHYDAELKPHWCGVADMVMGDNAISEIKSYQLKKFAMYADCLREKDTELFKKDFPQEYWQIVSNVILHDVEYGEAISFMPYKDDLERIRLDIEDNNFCERYGFNPWDLRFLTEAKIEDLAYIEKGGYYKNLEKFTFKVPEKDKEFLTERVRLAIIELKK